LTNKCSQELYFVETAAIISRFQNLLCQFKNDKLNSTFAKFFEFCFIAATIEKTTRLGDNWQINVTRTLFCVLKQQLFPRPMLGAKNDKTKIRFCKSLVLFYILHIDKQQDLGDNWQNKCSQELFCTKTNTIISTYKKTL
jgi:hypothetical protein